jgi:dolichyl-phosphate beta-glucosyltransferase
LNVRAGFVIPCFNEERRLDEARFADLARDPRADLLLVDDGSHDRTLDVLERIRSAAGEKVQVLRLAENQGKGEAVAL